MNPCSYGECTQPVFAKGLCNTHYYRKRRGQDMDAPLPSRKDRVIPEWEPGLVTHSPAGNIILHGGSGMGYKSYGCRCRACTEANRYRTEEDRKRRHTEDIPDTVPHGRATTYTNWGCRCQPCTDAQNQKTMSYYHRNLSAEARYKAEMEAYEAGRRQGPKPRRKRGSRSEK